MHILRLDSLFAAILDIATDAIISVDAKQRIVLYNRGAEHIFGWTAEEIVGKPLNVLIPQRFRRDHGHQVARFGAGAEVSRHMGYRREIWGLRKGGDEFPAEASISKLDSHTGCLYTVVLRDISDRKLVEEERRRARDEILGIVSHDLQNPVTAIAMCARGLLDLESEQPEKRRELAEAIHQATQMMQRMISDLLDVASIEAGKLAMELAKEEVAPIVQRTLAMTRAQGLERSVTITGIVAKDIPYIHADADRIVECLTNLVSNAVKFSSAGSVVIVRAEPGDNDDVVFSVSDNGPGILEEELPHIFDRYWQARRKPRRAGAGLGLTIVKGISEAHGGRVWVESTFGEGSKFSFSIPTWPS